MPNRKPAVRPPSQGSLRNATSKPSEGVVAAATAVERERPPFEQFLLTAPKDPAGTKDTSRIALTLRDVISDRPARS